MSATYQSFNLFEMSQVLKPHQGWIPAPVDPTFPAKEHVFDWPITELKGLSIRVYTSVLLSTNETRAKGSDAIRVCVPRRLKSKRINRTAGWEDRLRDLVRKTLATIREIEAKKAALSGTMTLKEVEAQDAALTYDAAKKLLDRAASNGLKYPKITLCAGHDSVRFALMGEKSKYPGDVAVSNGGGFNDPNRKYYGRIEAKDGSWIRPQSTSESVVDLVIQFTKNPIDTIVKLGQKTGHCQFCMKELSTQESLGAGYGPVCAKHWGLPWGGKEAS